MPAERRENKSKDSTDRKGEVDSGRTAERFFECKAVNHLCH